MSKYHTLIKNFKAGGQKLRQAVDRVTREEALAKPGPGKWSIQELVIHLVDSDAILIDRMKRVIAEDNPSLLCADEQAYVDRLHCDDQSLDDAVTLFDLSRCQFSRVLYKLDDAEFDRFGTHSAELGKITLKELIKVYSNHLDHHLKFLKDKRLRLRNKSE